MTRTRIGRPTARLHLESLEDRSVPSTFTVNTTLDDVTPANGKFSLREAITKANTTPGADVIVVPAGVFKITISGTSESNNNTGDFDVSDAVAIQGAGAGVSIVDGQQIDRVFDVFGTVPSSFKAVFKGLTVRNGSVTGDCGGIRVGNADLVVRDCVVGGNRASGDGGGISNTGAFGTGNVTLVHTTLARNVAGVHGGGLAVVSSSLTVKDSTVRRNIAGSSGSGIYASELVLTGSTVSGNTAGGYGGGINATTATLIGSTVSGNKAGGGGGGIGSTSTVTLTDCAVSGNSAGITGGGIWVDSTATLTRCTVSGNSTDGSGINAATATLTNSTVSGNSAGDTGGGIWANAATLLNCTIVENSAHTGGGLFHNPSSTFNVRNTIVALNLVDFTGTGPDVSGLFVSGGHNLIGIGAFLAGFANGIKGDQVGNTTNPIDPKLGPLANNGGKTKTHTLLAASPAIDKGDNAALPPNDQRGFGFSRKKDGNFDGLAIVDIGAFER